MNGTLIEKFQEHKPRPALDTGTRILANSDIYGTENFENLKKNYYIVIGVQC